MSFHFNLTRAGTGPEAIGKPVGDSGEAIACAQRLAIDLAEERQDLLGKGYAVVVIDDAGKGNSPRAHRQRLQARLAEFGPCSDPGKRPPSCCRAAKSWRNR